MKKQISVIVPTYNEEASILSLITRLHNALTSKKFVYEIIVIDDNSTDNTLKIIQKLSKFSVVSYLKKGKKGKSYSLCEGFLKAKYSTIGFIDADLQYAPEDLVDMALQLKSNDIVVANRRHYKTNFVRKFLSRGFRHGFGKLLFGLNYDIQSGLKVFTKEVLQTVQFKPASPWTFDLEFLYVASEAGFKIKSYDITFSKRKKGDSKVQLATAISEIGLGALKLKLSAVHPKIVYPEAKKTMRGAGVRYKKRKYITHTTLDYRLSSIKTFTFLQRSLLIETILLASIGIVVNPVATLSVIVGALSIIYFADTVFNLLLVLKSLHIPQEVKVGTKALQSLKDNDLPVYTILCPLYKEAHVIPQFLENISKLSWPEEKLDVLLLLEEDDKESIASVKRMLLPTFVRVIVVPDTQPKTKPKACNYGLSFAKGELLVIYDAEDMPESMQLKKAFLAFKKVHKNVICLQAKLNYYNPSQNLLTRFFTAEYSLWFDVTLPGLQSIKTSIPLGGTSNHFRTKDIHMLEGWDPFNVTEDADLGMRLFKRGFKTAIIDSITLEEANSKWGNWVRQRSRWIKGYMQTYLVHTRDPLSFILKKWQHYPVFHMIIGGKIAFILINPILWLATVSYFTLYAYVGPAIEKIYPSVIFYLAVISLVFGNFLFMYYYMIGVMKRKQYELVKYVFLVPFYWLMISYAGMIALYQLFFKPFYWEKTVHGLHLLNTSAAKEKAKVSVKVSVFPRPAFLYAFVSKSFVYPLTFIGNFEKGLFKGFAAVFILIGKAERNALYFLALSFKKIVVAPLKFATSIFF